MVKVSAGSALALGAAMGAALVPIGSVNSWWWNRVASHVGDFRDEVGWPELVATVAEIRDALPAADRAGLGILAGNYGEAGAIDLYGPRYGLPKAISGINSYWLRGYGEPPPSTLIVIGLARSARQQHFTSCQVAGHITNRYHVNTEETEDHPDIFICRGLRESWPEFWKNFRYYG
jgi:hypothetical protein